MNLYIYIFNRCVFATKFDKKSVIRSVLRIEILSVKIRDYFVIKVRKSVSRETLQYEYALMVIIFILCDLMRMRLSTFGTNSAQNLKSN